MRVTVDGLMPLPTALERINTYTRAIYDRLALPVAGADGRPPYRHDFFASHTRLDRTEYAPSTLAPLLAQLGVSAAEYAQTGLTLIRSTVMNPYHDLAREAGVDYLSEFVRYLGALAQEVWHGEQPAVETQRRRPEQRLRDFDHRRLALVESV
ncbi:MAG TPA: hypothetical protein VEF89_30325 [Solirubrobacteraceae bacterium]|nr:hypothetical protein [Solirubrobacteraceae bacterium]